MDDNGSDRVTEVDDYTAQERAALTAFHILEGAELTTQEIADRTGVTRQAAWSMMQRVSRVVPVYQERGRWKRLRRRRRRKFSR